MLKREDANRLVLAEYENLIRTLRKKLHLNDLDALDLAHEAIMLLYESLKNYDPERGSFGAWTGGIIRNVILKFREGRFRGHLVHEDLEHASGISSSALGDMIVSEIDGFIRKSVHALPDIYRETIELRYLKGLSIKEIARKLKVPEGTVKARLSRAPDMLKENLRIQETTARFYLDQVKRRRPAP